MTPTWEKTGFDMDLPQALQEGAEPEEGRYISGMMMDSRLVYRLFSVREGGIKELCRYIFFKSKIFREGCNHTRKEVSCEVLSSEKARDLADDFSMKELFELFERQADIEGKSAMLRIMPYTRRELYRMGFHPFLEIYRMTRKRKAKDGSIPAVILRELYGRNMSPYTCVRISGSLTAITGEKNCRYLYLKEQTRVYFDETRIYYFVKNAATGLWEEKELCKELEYELNLKDRLLDRELFKGTYGEKFAGFAAGGKQSSRRIMYGSLLAKAGFLSAEQAAKTDKKLYRVILENIFRGYIKEGDLSLPELMGVTGPQLKYLAEIDIPYNFKLFTKCLKDEEFREYFPDVKKRLFAASFFLNDLCRYVNGDLKEARKELFAAAQTICSLEKYPREKRRLLSQEYADYLLMRRRYLEVKAAIHADSSLEKEIEAFGEPKINVKPSKIHDRHNKLNNLMGILESREIIEKNDKFIIDRKRREAEVIEYTNGKYSVLMPDSAADIIREGRILHHCVGHGGYIEAMAEGQCRILFVRDNLCIDKPLITMEERAGRIKQCYGFEDSLNANPEIRDFIGEYLKVQGWENEAVIYSEKSAPTQ